MKHSLLTAFLLSSLCTLHAEEDLLNFKNSDTLHGQFGGFNGEGKMVWQNQQATEAITFDTAEIRRVIFNKGLLTKQFTHNNSITLVNGDILPCEILSISEKLVSIRTDYAGNLNIPREQVHSCDVHPHGQQILYQGPFIKENWDVLDFDDKEDEKKLSWEYSNFSWFNDGTAGAIKNKKLELPDSFRMTFKAEMGRYSNVCVVFHADFQVPEIKDEENKKKQLANPDKIASSFGSCIVLRINSSATNLSQYTFDADGKPVVNKVATTSGSSSARYSSDDYEDSELELRVDRLKGLVSTYTDGELVAQWNLSDIGYKAKGSGLGFVNLYNSNSRIARLSNIIVSPWNGIRDSALSLQNEQRDIILLTNGTDRFSGEIMKLEEKVVTLKGPYAEMEIPTEQIKSLNFATDKMAKSNESGSDSVAFRFYGIGRLSGTPVEGNKESVILNHPIIGKVTLSYDYLSSIDYTPDTAIIDRWNLKL